MTNDDDLLRPDGQYDLAKMAARRARLIALAHENCRAVLHYEGQPDNYEFTADHLVCFAAALLEDARDALAGQNESPGMTLPTHDEILEKRYRGTADVLEILLFDLEVDNPQRAEQLRAVIEGRPAVPVVTP